MKKYQWNDTSLQKRAELCNGLSLLFAVVALAVYFLGASPWVILGLAVVVVASYAVSWRLQNRDAKQKGKN